MLILRRAVGKTRACNVCRCCCRLSYSFYIHFFNSLFFYWDFNFCFSDPKLLSAPSRGRTTTLKGSGCSTTPSRPCKLGSGAPLGSLKLIRCNSEDRKRKSSSLANDSPTQTRGPAPNGRKQDGVTRWPRLSIKRSKEVWNKRWQPGQVDFRRRDFGLSWWCGTWVEEVGFVPLLGIMMNWPHVDQNASSWLNAVTSNAGGELKIF